jgi:amidase
MFYSTTQSAAKAESTGEKQVADQGLVQATACAIVDRLNSGEVTPLDLLDVLEARIALRSTRMLFPHVPTFSSSISKPTAR